jgi:hypothetical protein
LTNGLASDRGWGAKPTGRFVLLEWRVSAKADARIDDAECLELVGSGNVVTGEQIAAWNIPAAS